MGRGVGGGVGGGKGLRDGGGRVNRTYFIVTAVCTELVCAGKQGRLVYRQTYIWV